VLGFAFFQPSRVGEAPEKAGKGRRMRISIAGMTCSHCAKAVQRALVESPGIASAEVDLKKGEATVAGNGFDVAQLKQAVEALGYKVTGTDEPDDSR
jgi:copper chaperone